LIIKSQWSVYFLPKQTPMKSVLFVCGVSLLYRFRISGLPSSSTSWPVHTLWNTYDKSLQSCDAENIFWQINLTFLPAYLCLKLWWFKIFGIFNSMKGGKNLRGYRVRYPLPMSFLWSQCHSLKPWFSRTPHPWMQGAWYVNALAGWKFCNRRVSYLCVKASFSLQFMCNWRILDGPSSISVEEDKSHVFGKWGSGYLSVKLTAVCSIPY
jgi:hypothetical protein